MFMQPTFVTVPINDIGGMVGNDSDEQRWNRLLFNSRRWWVCCWEERRGRKRWSG